MRVPSHPTLIRRMLDSRLKQLGLNTPVLATTLSHVHKRCGKASCACHHGGPLHSAHHLTYKEQGKTRTLYVPVDLLPEVQTWVEQHQRLKQLLTEINLLTLALIRGHAQQQRRKGKRP